MVVVSVVMSKEEDLEGILTLTLLVARDARSPSLELHSTRILRISRRRQPTSSILDNDPELSCTTVKMVRFHFFSPYRLACSFEAVKTLYNN